MKMLTICFLVVHINIATWATEPVTNSQKTNDEEFCIADFQKFYIGFSGTVEGFRLITLKIDKIDSLRDCIWFQYTMNSKDNREEGEGKIYLDKNLIVLSTQDSGHIGRQIDGKIYFESIDKDSLNYWKILEK
jgi:hypothetical protein